MRLPLKVFSYFMAGALAFIALLSPTAVDAQTANVSVSVSSADPEVASVMPEGSSWSITHVDSSETMGDTFSPDHLTLPAVIPVQAEVPTGEYLVTVNAGPTFEAYDSVSVTVDESTETIPVSLVPVVQTPEPVMAPVTAAAYACENLDAPGLLTDVGEDCTPTSSSFDFYLVGDNSDEVNYSLAVDGFGTVNVEVGAYEVFAADGTTFELNVPEAGTSFAYGYPAAAPAPDPGIVTINISSADPDVASEMAPGSTWTVSDGVNTLSDEFAEADLALPATILTNNPVPGGTYTATVSAGADFQPFSAEFAVNGDTSVDIVLTPVPVVPDPEPATLNVSTYACEGVTGNPVVLGEVGPDCTPIAADLSFYLWGDETDDSWQVTTSETGAVAIELPTAGGYDVVNEATQTTVGVEVPAGASDVAFGYPAFNTPEPETGTATANVFHCLALEAPGPLTDVGDDCIPGPAAFDFYMVGDNTDDAIRLTVGEDGVNSIALPVGEYEVYEVSTDTRLDNVIVTANAESAFTFGIPRVEAPPAETGILSVSTYSCEGLNEGVVLGEIGDDCTRISTDLSFYLWGDGTDTNWSLTTSDAGPVDHELPIGSYEVIDEATQWTFSATVTAEGSEIAFGIPASAEAPIETSLIIQLVLPNGENIEGAPFSIYAPVAAQQFMAEPYVTGFVGPNNVIQVDDLTPGIYRVVVEPEGMAPIDFQVEVGAGVTEALVTVNADGTIDVAYGFQDPPPADPPADDPSADDPPVSGLPETGTGTGSNVGALGALVGGAVLAAGALGVRIRKS